ncbi:FAD-dependent monooxygenase [Penicillium ucsense]|uniref:FAD dependent monooxygenase n=1 Tax=Penicillium ucsense TaxID=2839758 RepID=A0A8J8W5X7_9EURO|nr:FAD dependent monooxygenase [Penicillium ucsense]KAF7736180.1 FAD-dependent monooxygenase [Penicillium ucsense]
MGSLVRNHVTVGIVGGGVAGLALAKMLEMSGISYRLWESHHRFVPLAGASVGVLPNGLRILDQLGMINAINQYNVKRQVWEHRDADGKLHASFNPGAVMEEKLGYGGVLMERHHLLRILHESIEDKTKLFSSKRVVSVSQADSGATIVADDGSQLACEILAGADGVKSVVRREIEKETMSRSENPDFQFDAQFVCVWGISDPVSSIGPGRSFTIYRPGESLLVFSGHGGVTSWFVTREIQAGEASRQCSDQESQALCGQVADVTVTDGTKFAAILRQRRFTIMTALEEGLADRFSFGRLFLLGDSAHKMVPHGAMGANQALESAAAFTNLLRPLVSQTETGGMRKILSRPEVESCLSQYEKRRRDRAAAVLRASGLGCRAHLKIGPESEAYWSNLHQMTSSEGIAKMLTSMCSAEKLDDWDGGSSNVKVYTSFARAQQAA